MPPRNLALPWTSSGGSEVRLVRIERDGLEALADGALATAERLAAFALDPWLVEERPRRTLAHRCAQLVTTPSDHDWVTRFVVVGSRVVGLAGFHGAPDASGSVEVGYQIAETHRRRGYARAALAILLDVATAERTVRASIAPSNEASLTLVAAFGFVQVGEQWDDEDGRELVFERRGSRFEVRGSRAARCARRGGGIADGFTATSAGAAMSLLMKLGVAGVVACLSLLGCHQHGAQWPATLPKGPILSAVDQCVSIGAQLDDGSAGVPFASHAPHNAHIVAARCEDAGLCAVEIRPSATGDVALVHGMRVGRGFVDVVYEEGPAGRRADGKAEVVFSAVPPDPPPPRVRQERHACPAIASDAIAPWPAPR